MRLLRLHAVRFGPIRDRLLDLDDDAVIVFGRNESGKTSFRSAIETIVYGFDPATRDKHPLWGWDGGAGGDLYLEAELRLDSGELQRVERVLQSTGKLRIASGSEQFHGRREGNRPLPWSSLPREVFHAIHSLELDDLTQLDHGVEGHVDDLLLPENPGLELRPASDVRRALREDAQRLLLLAIGITILFPSGIHTVVIAIVAVGWASFARSIRGQILTLREAAFIESARSVGCSHLRILFRHLLPQCIPPLLVMSGLKVGSYILTESALRFLGLGAQPPTATWGSMISANRVYISSAPWMVIFPGFMISLTVLCFTILGDTLRDRYGLTIKERL